MVSARIHAFFLFLPFLFVSCARSGGVLEMQSIAPEELSPLVRWAVVSDPYVACRKEASYNSPAVSSFRKDEIYMVKGSCTVKIDEKPELWYALEDGWVPGSAVNVYSNKFRARFSIRK